MPLFQRINTLVADMPRGTKVRFADTKRNRILHLAHDVEELTDAGGLQSDNLVCNRISHGVINSLSSSYFFVSTVP